MAATYAGPWILWALTLLWSAADSANPHYFVSHPDHRVAPDYGSAAKYSNIEPEEFRQFIYSFLILCQSLKDVILKKKMPSTLLVEKYGSLL
ncbi:hypothetical protein TNCT_617171 [Trichonephila clavata]|uniref:Uncharacterized protein n=1 Tax=Trichonephila clavata TaxID=2740835 RepID=A0A8X6K9U6_TRICU|nr:hypothetical protein TNCT_617171 [Trichonephila clavata]